MWRDFVIAVLPAEIECPSFWRLRDATVKFALEDKPTVRYNFGLSIHRYIPYCIFIDAAEKPGRNRNGPISGHQRW
jgi:hypothetical protein